MTTILRAPTVVPIRANTRGYDPRYPLSPASRFLVDPSAYIFRDTDSPSRFSTPVAPFLYQIQCDSFALRNTAVVTASPFIPSIFPNPSQSKRGLFWLEQGTPLVLSQCVLPPGQQESPKPRPGDFPIALRTHADPVKLNLLGQDVFFGLAGHPNYDQPNPIGPVTYQHRTFVNTINLNLLGQDFFPIRAVDVPFPPGSRPTNINRTFEHSTPLPLIGQDKVYGAPGQVPTYVFTNPVLLPSRLPTIFEPLSPMAMSEETILAIYICAHSEHTVFVDCRSGHTSLVDAALSQTVIVDSRIGRAPC